jgi:hypothetical protein
MLWERQVIEGGSVEKEALHFKKGSQGSPTGKVTFG